MLPIRVPSSSRHRQRGVAALAIALLIVVIATAVTVGVAQIAVGDQKSIANELRSRQAGSMAELALERGILYLRQRKSAGAVGAMGSWTACASASTALPCGDGERNLFGSEWTAIGPLDSTTLALSSEKLAPTGPAISGFFSVYYVARRASAGSAAPGNGVYHVIVRGLSEDSGATALVRKAMIFTPFLARAPDSPLIAAGTIGITGTLSIVANPNGGGTGVPLSSWSGANTSLHGAMQSCHITEYLSTDSTTTTQTDDNGHSLVLCPSCECPNDSDLQLSNDGREGIDILDVDQAVNGGPSSTDVNPDSAYFPSDVFEYIFGVPQTQYQTIKDNAQQIASCDSLGPSSHGLFWIAGACEIPSNTVVGSFAAPVLLVIEDGSFRMNANSTFIGLLFAFANAGSVSVTINGGPTLVGALVSNQNIDLGNGNYTARYDRQTLENLGNGGSNPPGLLSIIPGSWTDHQRP